MALGIGLEATLGGAAVLVVAAGIAYRYATSGGDVSVEADTAAGSVDVDASSAAQSPPGGTQAKDDEVDSGEDPLEELYVTELEQIEGVGPARSEALRDAGFETAEEVADATVEALTAAEGVGEARATSLQQAAVTALEE